MGDNSNRIYWDALCETDPAATKLVAFGARKFTAIDPQYQILRFTEQFGPIGEDWGWTSQHGTEYINVTDSVLAVAWSDVTLWYKDRDNCWFGPMRGCAQLISAKGKIDNDAWKKATTDALTKLLSHVGTNADVFMGKFDDNKYVDEIRAKIVEHAKGDAGKMADKIIKAINACNTRDELDVAVEANRPAFEDLKKNNRVFAQRIAKAKETKVTELEQGATTDGGSE